MINLDDKPQDQTGNVPGTQVPGAPTETPKPVVEPPVVDETPTPEPKETPVSTPEPATEGSGAPEVTPTEEPAA